MQSLHRVTVGRTREVRGPDAMERAFAGIVIAVVMSIAVWFGMRLGHMVQSLDAISLAFGPEYNEIIYYSMHGRWPSPDNPHMIAPGHGFYVRNLALGKDGVLTAELTLRPLAGFGTTQTLTGSQTTHGFLSFRPELLGSRDAPTITFLCGYARPVTGPSGTSKTNKTTLAWQDLPPFCR